MKSKNQWKSAVWLITGALLGASATMVVSAAGGAGPAAPGYSGALTIEFETRDRDEALAWFRDVVGFEHVFTNEEMNWSEVRTPAAGVTIGFEEVRERPVRASALAIGVRNIERARAALEERGARFVGPTIDYGPVRIARFTDPSGNMYEIYQGG